MKKIVLMAAACCMLALSATFVSCDTNSPQCWKFIVTSQENVTVQYYFYGTGVEAEAQMKVYERGNVKQVRYEQTFLSKENCHE